MRISVNYGKKIRNNYWGRKIFGGVSLIPTAKTEKKYQKLNANF
jgi:hypothetical protein